MSIDHDLPVPQVQAFLVDNISLLTDILAATGGGGGGVTYTHATVVTSGVLSGSGLTTFNLVSLPVFDLVNVYGLTLTVQYTSPTPPTTVVIPLANLFMSGPPGSPRMPFASIFNICPFQTVNMQISAEGVVVPGSGYSLQLEIYIPADVVSGFFSVSMYYGTATP